MRSVLFLIYTDGHLSTIYTCNLSNTKDCFPKQIVIVIYDFVAPHTQLMRFFICSKTYSLMDAKSKCSSPLTASLSASS